MSIIGSATKLSKVIIGKAFTIAGARSVDAVAKCCRASTNSDRKQVLLIVEFTQAHFVRLFIIFPEVRFGFIIASLHELLIEVYEKISGFS